MLPKNRINMQKVILSAIFVFVFAAFQTAQVLAQGDTWETLRWLRTSATPASPQGEAMVSKVEEVLEVFKRAQPLNPPRGLVVNPRSEFVASPSLTGNRQWPQSVRLNLMMRFPYANSDVTAGVRVWINETGSLLGDPVLADGSGEIYLLPPLMESIGGQTLFNRCAHPPGYEERFPAPGFFPLWDNNVEPFLRSVVRPTFGLHQASVITVLTRGGEAFWKPVSQERWIRAMLDRAQAELDLFSEGYSAAMEQEIPQQQIDQMWLYINRMRDMYQEQAVIERHEKFIEQTIQTYEKVKVFNPEEAKKMLDNTIDEAEGLLVQQLEAAVEQRAKIDEWERKLTEALMTQGEILARIEGAIRSRDWDAIEKVGKELDVDHLVFIADAGRAAEGLKAELNSLTPAQRSAPAYGFILPPWPSMGTYRHIMAMDFEAERPSGLVSPDAEGARALVYIDEDFFASAGNESAIRVMSVEWWELIDARYRSEGGMFYNERRVTMLNDLWRGVDWNALRRMTE